MLKENKFNLCQSILNKLKDVCLDDKNSLEFIQGEIFLLKNAKYYRRYSAF